MCDCGKLFDKTDSRAYSLFFLKKFVGESHTVSFSIFFKKEKWRFHELFDDVSALFFMF